MINKSLGLNIGFPYQKNATEVKEEDLTLKGSVNLTNIFLLDLVMINIDRTSTNINLMKVEGEIFSVDYESSLLIQEILGGQDLLNNPRVLQCLQMNPLYQEVDEVIINEFIDKLDNISFEKIFFQIPNDLLKKEDSKFIIQQIEERKRQKWGLKKILNKLKNIVPESQKEKKIRIRKNQEIFLKKINKHKL